MNLYNPTIYGNDVQEIPVDSVKRDIFLQDLCEEGGMLKVAPFLGEKRLNLRFPENSMSLLAYVIDKKKSLVPFWCPSSEQMPKGTCFIFIKQQEHFIILLSLSYGHHVAFFEGNQEGVSLVVNQTEEALPITPLVACIGKDFYETLKQAFTLFLRESGGLGKLREEKHPLPSWLTFLGWESSLCFGSKISHGKILDAFLRLKVTASHIWPRFVLIDEGWQDLTGESLRSFQADPRRFPKGLKGLIADLKKEGITHVGVWHGIMGARGGICESLSLHYGLEFKDGKGLLGKHLGKTFEFFNDYYAALKEEGVDFIKVGDQEFPFRELGGETLPKYYKNLHSAMQAAASLHFDYTYFNAECLRSENLIHWSNSQLARASVGQEGGSTLSIKKGILENLMNGIWLQTLMWPDFDAWKTKGILSETLAIYHALSGSINVISDPPGDHDSSKLKKIALPSGELLKTDAPLLVCPEVIFKNPLKEKCIYKAFTRKGETGIVAVFHLSESSILHGEISSADIPTLCGAHFAVFSHRKGFVGIFEKGERIKLSLKFLDSDVWTFAPVIDGIAVFGCYAYYLAPGPVVEINREDGMLHIVAKTGSPLLLYSERPILDIRRNGEILPWEYDEQSGVLSIGSRDGDNETLSFYTIRFEN